MTSCHNCYSHYTSRNFLPPNGCLPCYDDGFGIGPYFRQGPFYRPGFAHIPSCFQIGTCGLPYMNNYDLNTIVPNMQFPPINYGMDNGYFDAFNGYSVPNLGYPYTTYSCTIEQKCNVTVINEENKNMN